MGALATALAGLYFLSLPMIALNTELLPALSSEFGRSREHNTKLDAVRFPNRLLPRRAKRILKLAADTRVADWTLGAEVQASSRRYDNAANTNVLSGYGLVNLYASTTIAREWTLLARIDNLGDKAYELARTYATPGRTLYVGLKWSPR